MKPEIEIIPALLPENFEHLQDEVNHVADHVKTVQIDVVDGKFAPTTTWPFNGADAQKWQALVNQDEGLPHWEEVDYEIDIMADDQLGTARDWISAGVARVIAHIESLSDESITEFKSLRENFDVELYVSLEPSTPNSVLDEHLDYIDGVQFMGNDKIGYHGVQLDEKVLDKIRDLRQKRPDLQIGIDIGVNMDTIPELAKAGVNRFASGSLILNSDSPKQTVAEMKKLASV
jgi:ribulose-phosphate 3-epimerase